MQDRDYLIDRGPSLHINGRASNWFLKNGTFSPKSKKEPFLPAGPIEDPHAVARLEKDPITSLH
ncbi:hypothetical protein NSU_1946 [Novosphingobium pentaromativorans US6-1]|uniref:Uncharacterized protein n=1 Tax=Novosphingobium pentaromativorans US6-1 TaxID=1088721 RepID=G6EC75_9SPHN|nr:hypothetical protein NSU_1946 [Novosphingobium pentaromativorans US6-1]